MAKVKKTDENVKNPQPALDIGSHINASLQLLPEARAERSEAEAGGSQLQGVVRCSIGTDSSLTALDLGKSRPRDVRRFPSLPAVPYRA